MSTITPAQPATPPSAAPAAPSAVPPATPPGAAPAAPPAATAPVTPGQPQAAVGGTPPVVDPAAPPAAPVVLTDVTQLQVPEGFAPDDAQAIAALAQKHQWTLEEAQAALDAAHAHNVEQRAAMSGRLQADQTFGGARLAQTQQAVQRVMDRFLPATSPLGAELRSVMNKTGYGDYLPLVALIASVGQAMGEDGMVIRAGTQTPSVVDPVQRLYGTKAT